MKPDSPTSGWVHCQARAATAPLSTSRGALPDWSARRVGVAAGVNATINCRCQRPALPLVERADPSGHR